MVRALAGGAVVLVEVDEGLLSSEASGVRGRAERGVVGPTERGNPGSQEPGLPDLFDLRNATVATRLLVHKATWSPMLTGFKIKKRFNYLISPGIEVYGR